VVRILDGRSPLSPVIAIVCGKVEQREYFSTGSSLLLELRADARWPGQGFEALYEFLPQNTATIRLTEQVADPPVGGVPGTSANGMYYSGGANTWNIGGVSSSSSSSCKHGIFGVVLHLGSVY